MSYALFLLTETAVYWDPTDDANHIISSHKIRDNRILVVGFHPPGFEQNPSSSVNTTSRLDISKWEAYSGAFWPRKSRGDGYPSWTYPDDPKLIERALVAFKARLQVEPLYEVGNALIRNCVAQKTINIYTSDGIIISTIAYNDKIYCHALNERFDKPSVQNRIGPPGMEFILGEDANRVVTEW